MAGAGWKVFSAGAVLTAAEVNTYLMDQSVMVFAGTAARASAIASPSEGMTTYLADTNTLKTYDGSNWVDTNALSETQTSGRNALVNGSMAVWQRSTSSSALGYSTADRWWVNNSAGTTTAAQESTTVPTGFRYALKLTQSSANGNVVAVQAMETADCLRFAGQTVTVSAYVAASASTSVTLDLSSSTSTDLTPSSHSGWLTPTSGSAVTVSSTTYQKVTFSYSVPSTVKSLAVRFNAATLSTGVSVYLTGVQLEVGPVATPFEFESYGDTLRKCQRYFQVIGSGSIGQSLSGTFHTFMINLKVPMRATPTLATASSISIVRLSVGTVSATGCVGTSWYGTYQGGWTDTGTSSTGGSAGDRVGIYTDCYSMSAEL